MEPSSAAADREALFARLAELGIASVTVEHEPVFTVGESQALRDRLPGAHTKNLFVMDKDGRAALIVAKDDSRVDLKVTAKRLGLGRLSFGKPERLFDLLGVTPGSVTPFALINDPGTSVIVAVDAALIPFAEVNFHPLENTATTRLATQDFLRFVRACGHEPIILPLS
jgi:Ala-tRNA(Pro) deacylase